MRFNRFDSLNVANVMGLLVVGQKRFVDTRKEKMKRKNDRPKSGGNQTSRQMRIYFILLNVVDVTIEKVA